MSRRVGLALQAVAFLGGAVLFALLPRFISSFHALEWSQVAIYFIALLGLNVLTGYSGQISLGHGAFMAIGGYTSAILIAHHGMRDVWTIPLAGLVAGAVGLAFGLPALRLTGLYLALATFGVAVAFPALVRKFDHFTGGNEGLILTLHTNDWLYYVSWAIAGGGLLLAWLVLATPIGRSFRALRDSEVAAVSSGVSPAFYKTLAFGISACYAGVAGSLFAISGAFVTPQTFPITLSLFLVVGLAVGGIGWLPGGVVGGILIQFLPTYASDVSKQAPQVIHGLILVGLMLLLPGGVAGLLRLLGANARVVHSSVTAVTRTLPLLVVALLLGASAAGARPAATPGVSSSSILLGGTAPLTGEASSAAGVARGAEAYFKYVNGRGGVFGRKINYKYVDDGYEPQRTFLAVRQLVQQDNVFAIFNSLGTSHNAAVRGFLNQAGVPQLFVASGATTFGRDYKKYPWTIGYIPTYSAEGKVYARYLSKRKPKAKIAILYQDDQYGKELVAGLQAGLGKKKSLIVKKVGYDPTASDVRSEVAALKASKAKVFMIFAFGKFSVQAFITANQLGWRPLTVVNDVAAATSLMQLSPKKATEGALSVVFGKDPDSPIWKRDKGMKLFRSIMARYGGGQNPNGYHAAGMAAAYTMVDTLRKAGKNLTRKGVMRAATHLNERANPFVLPKIPIRTTPSFRFPIAKVRMERWHDGHWVLFGPLVSARP